jgi:mono/diheme cytochrome c family protein
MRYLPLLALAACLHLRPASEEKVEATAERVARGSYLANAAFGCMACHSDVDDTKYALPPKDGTTPGAGGQCWDESVHFPGGVCAPNLTSDAETGLGAWTDGQIMRAIREGIGHRDEGLFPLMPYRDYAHVSDEDVRSIVAYLRSLPPVKRPVAEKHLNFPVGIFIRLVPRPLEGPVAEPENVGEYLSRQCVRCHTPVNGRMQPLEDQRLAGGQEFHLRDGTAAKSPSLLVLTSWTPDQFIARFRGYKEPAPAQAGHNTPMPWLAYGDLSDEDLKAIYTFLITPPVKVTAAP